MVERWRAAEGSWPVAEWTNVSKTSMLLKKSFGTGRQRLVREGQQMNARVG
jgi:hypothetical protein